VYDKAVRDLHREGLEVIVHVILGLPGETAEDMAETVRYVADSGAEGIKLQLLHVLKGTDLEMEYLEGRVPVMTLEEYINVLKAVTKEIPERLVVHRLTGDGPKNLLLAPLWSADKKRVLNTIRRELNLNE
jgi:radical SAM protein (TIGR01212 family)